VTCDWWQVAELAKELGLKPHKVKDGEGKEVELFSPVETKGILGSGRRYGRRAGPWVALAAHQAPGVTAATDTHSVSL